MPGHGHCGIGPRRVYRSLEASPLLYAQVGTADSARDIRRGPQLDDGGSGEPPLDLAEHGYGLGADVPIHPPGPADRNPMVWQDHITIDRPFDNQMLAGGDLAYDVNPAPDRGDNCRTGNRRPVGGVGRNGNGRLSFCGRHIKEPRSLVDCLTLLRMDSGLERLRASTLTNLQAGRNIRWPRPRPTRAPVL